MEAMSRTLIVIGLAIAGLGLLLHFGASVPWLGRLPGDIRIERQGFRVYIPLATCLVLSVGLSAILWLLSKFR
jgi:hypothetical protein